MIKLFTYPKRLYNWSRRPWPLHIFPVLIAIHVLLLRLLPENYIQVNDYCSAFFQILGGLIVLCSINSNMRLLSKSNIRHEIYDWIKTFPLRAKNQTINLSGAISSLTMKSYGEMSSTPKLSTIEEKVEYLLKKTERIELRIDDIKKQFQKKLQLSTEKNSKKSNKLQNEMCKIEKNLRNTIVGSVKLEVLGILTISYGIVIPIMC